MTEVTEYIDKLLTCIKLNGATLKNLKEMIQILDQKYLEMDRKIKQLEGKVGEK